MVDGWRGVDWFHNGAFRLVNMAYIYDQEATRKSEVKWPQTHRDEYDAFLAGSAGEIGRQRGIRRPVSLRARLVELLLGMAPRADVFVRDDRAATALHAAAGPHALAALPVVGHLAGRTHRIGLEHALAVLGVWLARKSASSMRKA